MSGYVHALPIFVYLLLIADVGFLLMTEVCFVVAGGTQQAGYGGVV